MTIPRINWADRSPVILLKMTSICVAIPMFVLCWVGFVWLTFCRLNNARLTARMDLVAAVLATESQDSSNATAAATRILDDAKKGKRTGVKLGWQTSELSSVPKLSAKEQTELDSEFVKAAADVMLNHDDNSEFASSYAQLGFLGKMLSDDRLYGRLADGVETKRPLLLERMFHGYFTFEGVSFRRPADLDEARKSAKEYLRCRDEGFAGMFKMDLLLRPWVILRFYDPKRVLLNDMLPFLLLELVLVSGLFLRYRYYDTEFQGTMECRQRAVRWIPLWETPLAGKSWQKLRFSPAWLLWIAAAVMICLIIELVQNDPEIAAERWINCPMAIIAGACLSTGIPALVSILCSKFSSDFLSCPRALKERVVRPLTIGVVGLVVLSIFVGYFSFDQLIVRGNPEMKYRGIFQILFSGALVIVAVLYVFFFRWLVLSKGNDGLGPSGVNEEFNAPESPWCMNFVTDKIDEKVILAIITILIPIGVELLG